MEMNDKIIIETKSLAKKFTHNWAISDINLTVRKGQIYGFLGPNGAGKSTTIRLLMGLIKPTKGSFQLFGKRPGLFKRDMYKKVGSLIEEPSFYNYLTGAKNLYYLGNLTKEVSWGKVDEILELVGLQKARNKKVDKYSHGMKKRLGLAQALIHDPELLILDEPISGLDPEGLHNMQSLFKRLTNDLNKTVFFSSHNLKEIESLCTHMGIINYGKVVVQGAVEELLKNTDFFITEVKVDEPQEALELLMQQKWVNKIFIENDKLKIHIASQDRPRLTKLLVESGFNVYSIKPRTSIEDYYVSLTRKHNKKNEIQ